MLALMYTVRLAHDAVGRLFFNQNLLLWMMTMCMSIVKEALIYAGADTVYDHSWPIAIRYLSLSTILWRQYVGSREILSRYFMLWGELAERITWAIGRFLRLEDSRLIPSDCNFAHNYLTALAYTLVLLQIMNGLGHRHVAGRSRTDLAFYLRWLCKILGCWLLSVLGGVEIDINAWVLE